MEGLLLKYTELKSLERGRENTMQAHLINSQSQQQTYTSDIQSTINQLMNYFAPEDAESSDGDHHK